MAYLDHIIKLMDRHGTTGYYYKDQSDLIGFHDGGGIAWYQKNGENFPIRVEQGTPEQEFDRLHHARFNRLRRGVSKMPTMNYMASEIGTLVDGGMEFPDAHTAVCEKYQLNKEQGNQLVELYDDRFDTGA